MKPANKRKRGNSGSRQASRTRRRREWIAMRAVFLLAGGHKDHLTPFSGDWRNTFPNMVASIERGNPYFTKPRNFNHGNISPTGRIQQWRDEYPAITRAWQTLTKTPDGK